MRAGLKKGLEKTVRFGVPGAAIFSVCTFVKNKVKTAKDPYILDLDVKRASEEEKQKSEQAQKHIIVVGGGLSGISTAYQLTENPHIKVTLFERHRRCMAESSSYNGGVFQINDYQPYTQKSFF